MREPKNRHRLSSASRVYNNFTAGNTSVLGSKQNKAKKAKCGKRMDSRLTVKESFFIEFAEEIDLFCLETRFPEWIIQYREEILNKIGRNFRKICRELKDSGVKFYVKYPVEIDGKWKFADVYIPDIRTVILLLNDKEMIGHPCNMRSDREQWFSDRFRVIGLFAEDIDSVLEKVL